MKTIKTFEDACAALKLDPAAVLPNFSMFPEHHRGAMTAHAKLIIIAEAANDGWKPDWKNTDEPKYVPWFDIDEDENSPSGLGFSYSDCDGWRTYTTVGSRLCYKDAETAQHVAETFLDLYREYVLMEK